MTTDEQDTMTHPQMKDLPPPVEMEHPPIQQSFQIPPEWAAYGLILFNRSADILQSLGSFVLSLAKGIYKGFLPQIYVFFKDSNYPYNLNDLNLTAPGVAEVEWYYDASRRTFVTRQLYESSKESRAHHLPFLSAEIKYNDLVLHEMTEFMESLRWAGNEGQEPPSAAILLSAWTLHTGIVLQKSESIHLLVIDDQGNEKSVSLRS